MFAMNFSFIADNITVTSDPACSGAHSFTMNQPSSHPLLSLHSAMEHNVKFYTSAVLLVLFTAVVVLGNTLVIVAVATTRKLRTSTNHFIVSLAFADLLVGIMVLPSSGTHEVLSYWPFGTTWCSVWLATDVLTCTSSILHLCAISLDRYLAIAFPFRYPSLMSAKRSKYLVSFVWFMAFCISMPPLIGWKAENNNNFVVNSMVTSPCINGSTISPDLGQTKQPEPSRPTCALTSDRGYVIFSALGSFWLPMLCMTYFYWKIYRTASRTTSALKRGVLITENGGGGANGESGAPSLAARRRGGRQSNVASLRMHRGGSSGSASGPKLKPGTDSHAHTPTHRYHGNGCQTPGSNLANTGSMSSSRTGRRVTNVKQQLRRVNKEKKAAKTVGIIVGAFVVCWLPFFSVYLAGAFCSRGPHCIASPTVFSVFFWLGYLNSAMNPFVYAYFSRDFRCSFERLLTIRKGCICGYGCRCGGVRRRWNGTRAGSAGAGWPRDLGTVGRGKSHEKMKIFGRRGNSVERERNNAGQLLHSCKEVNWSQKRTVSSES